MVEIGSGRADIGISRTAKARQLASDARLAAENGQSRLAFFLATESIKRESANQAILWRDVLTANGASSAIGILGHEGDVRSEAWSPDGKRMAAGSGADSGFGDGIV